LFINNLKLQDADCHAGCDAGSRMIIVTACGNPEPGLFLNGNSRAFTAWHFSRMTFGDHAAL
jgi:hypothetical protein